MARGKRKQWTEYYVSCRRWFRIRSEPDKKIWETVDLKAASEEQALSFYHDILKGLEEKGEADATLIRPILMVREVTEYPYKHKKAKK